MASGATGYTAAQVAARSKAALTHKRAGDASLKQRVERAHGRSAHASAPPLAAVGTYVPSQASYRPSRAHADASVFEKAGLAQTVRLLCSNGAGTPVLHALQRPTPMAETEHWGPNGCREFSNIH